MSAPNPAAVVARMIDQVRAYGYLMLTHDEMATIIELTKGDPHASLAIGPGKVVEVSGLVIYVLPNIYTEQDSSQ